MKTFILNTDPDRDINPFVISRPWLPHSGRNKDNITTAVIHATAGASALSSYLYMFRKLVNRVSYHYIIERDGTILKCVPLGKKAWHAGISNGPHGSDVNRYSIGISLANRNNGEEYTQEQVQALYDLINVLALGYPNLEWVTTHYHISPGRKNDPRYFNFRRFMDFVNHRMNHALREKGRKYFLKPWPSSPSNYGRDGLTRDNVGFTLKD